MRIALLAVVFASMACVGPFAPRLDGAWQSDEALTLVYRDGMAMSLYEGVCTAAVPVEVTDQGFGWVEVKTTDDLGGGSVTQRLRFRRGRLLLPIHEGREWEAYRRVDLESVEASNACLSDAVASTE